MSELKAGKFADTAAVYAIMLEELEKVVFQHDTDILVRIFWSDLNDGWDITIYREKSGENGWRFDQLDHAICYGSAEDAIVFFNNNGVKK